LKGDNVEERFEPLCQKHFCIHPASERAQQSTHAAANRQPPIMIMFNVVQVILPAHATRSFTQAICITISLYRRHNHRPS